MPKITFLPMNTTVEVSAGESILDTAINHDIPLPHACGGFCACTTCHVFVKSGLETLSEMDEEEMDRLELVSERQENSRLGCQTKIFHDVVVEIVNKDEF